MMKKAVLISAVLAAAGLLAAFCHAHRYEVQSVGASPEKIGEIRRLAVNHGIPLCWK